MPNKSTQPLLFFDLGDFLALTPTPGFDFPVPSYISKDIQVKARNEITLINFETWSREWFKVVLYGMYSLLSLPRGCYNGMKYNRFISAAAVQ